MKTSKALLMLTLGVLLAGCDARHLVFRPDDKRMTPKEKAYCIPIFLPRTVLEFRCTAVVKTTEPSVFFKKSKETNPPFTEAAVGQAAEELGIQLNKNNEKKVDLFVKDPVLTARGERDPNQLFFIKMESGLFKKVEFNSQFSSDGVPGSISSTVEDKAFEFTMKTIEVAAGIAGKVIATATKGPDVEKGEPNLLQSVVKQIRTLRANREALIRERTLPSHVDEKTLARMLDELAKSETELAAYFKGASKEESYPLVSTIRPSMPKGPPELERVQLTLLEFGDNTGFKAGKDGETVRLCSLPEGLRGKGTDTRVSTLILTVSGVSDTEARALRQIASARATDRGLPYRIPARAFAEITVEVKPEDSTKATKSLVKAEVLLAQWGTVAHLPPSVGSPGSTFKPIYYPDTGGLKELTVSGTPLSADSLGSLDKAAGSITDTLKAKTDKEAAAAKEKAAKEDELNLLKREGDILEQKVRIQGLQEKLPSPETP